MTQKIKDPTDLIRDEILQLKAYTVVDARGLIKLDAMENPYAWPKSLYAEWTDALTRSAVNRYPDPHPANLLNHLRDAFQIPAASGILLGNGSDELLQILITAIARPGATVLSVAPTFVMYDLLTRVAGLEYLSVPLTATFDLNEAELLQTIRKKQPELIFLAYPNNPTGNRFDDRVVEAVLNTASGLVILDEAYAAFTDHSYLERLSQFKNLLVLRTLSKMGMAGLRLGYLIGSPVWIEQLDKIRLPYNINVLTQVTVELALRHKAVFDEQVRLIRAERARLFQALQAVNGVQVFPSEANFLLLRTPKGLALPWHQGLRERGILIKNLHGSAPSLEDCLRVTVGTLAENDRFLSALTTISASIVPDAV